jgi:tryptophan synthase alpha subunit
VRTTGSASATKCATSLTTELTGSRSINECYKQKFQTAKAIKSPAKLKFGAKHETAARADAGMALDAVATGSCTVTKINKTVKVNGKNIKQPRWVIKATSKAGNCKVTFSNAGDYTYKPFTVIKNIKVTKTGK